MAFHVSIKKLSAHFKVQASSDMSTKVVELIGAPRPKFAQRTVLGNQFGVLIVV